RKPWTRIGSRLSFVSPCRARRIAPGGCGSFIPSGHDRTGPGRVRAQAEADRFQRDHVLRHDVAEVDVRTEAADEPHLLFLAWSFEQHAVRRYRVGDLIDQTHPHLAVVPGDPDVPALTCFGDDLPRSGVELLL